MKTRGVMAVVFLVAGVVADGCGGASDAQSGGRFAAGGSGGTASAGKDSGGATSAGKGGVVQAGMAGESFGGTAGSSSGRGGSPARAGRSAGGKGGKGGKGGSAGRAAAGGSGGTGTAGDLAGGGQSCESAGTAGEDHGQRQCCTGPGWGDDHDYYASAAVACGEPRSCEAFVWTTNCYDDTPYPYRLETRCCADGRWHLVRDAAQYEEDCCSIGDVLATGAPLSPSCGGVTLPSSHALHFDGASYLELPIAEASPDPSFELWLRTTSATGPLLSGGSPLHTLYLSGGKLCLYPSHSGAELCTPGVNLADGAWHHVAAVSDDALYIDGASVTRGSFAGWTALTTLRAGYGEIAGELATQDFDGDLDEIRVWRDGRDPFEIFDYYRTRFSDAPMPATLIGYFPLEESDLSTTTANLARPVDPESLCPYGGGGSGSTSEAPAGTLVGFGSAGSPWIAPGAF